MKKLGFLAFFLALSAQAVECKLTGVLESSKTIETSFMTSSLAECKALGLKTKTNKFFGLITEDDQLTEIVIRYRAEKPLKGVFPI